jgi:hypothetical protein
MVTGMVENQQSTKRMTMLCQRRSANNAGCSSQSYLPKTLCQMTLHQQRSNDNAPLMTQMTK